MSAAERGAGLRALSPDGLRTKAAWAREQAERCRLSVEPALAEFWVDLARDCEAVLAEQLNERGAQRDSAADADVAEVLEHLLQGYGCVVHVGTPLEVFGRGASVDG